MSVVFALGAALANAVNVVTQHIASTGSPPRARGLRLVGYLFRSPLWLFGWVALAGAFVCQAVALHFGPLSTVQPLLVTELVFALVLRRGWLHQRIRGITWGAAAVTSVGLAVFLLVAEPNGGVDRPAASDWIAPVVACAGTTAVLMVVGRAGGRGRRAVLYGSAAAVVWALVAAFLKMTTDVVARNGAAGLFLQWPVYALALAGLTAEILNQATLHAGPLSLSQPFLVTVDPLVSILLSVWIFQDRFTLHAGGLVVAVLSFSTMCVGVFALTRTAPATMAPAKRD